MRVVLTHHNADLDALASSVAATHLYEGAVAVSGSVVSPPVKRYLAIHKDHLDITPIGQINLNEVEEVIIVDVRDARRIKEYEAIIDAADRIVVWDHHPDTPFDVEADESYVEPIGACATLLVERLLAEGKRIAPTEATLYLLGIYSDTGRLSYCNTRPRDLKIAAKLLDLGANLKVVNRYLHREFTQEQTQLLLSMMTNTQEESFDSIEVAFSKARAPKFVRGASAVVEQILEFGGHDAVLGVVEFTKSQRVQIIGRSRISCLDIGSLLKGYGGGGHRGAGAAMVKKSNLEEVVTRLQEDLRRMPMNAVRVADIMSTPVVSFPHDTPLKEVQTKLHAMNISGAPVIRGGATCGVISRRDVFRAETRDKLALPVSSHMSHEVRSIDHNEPLEDALQLMTSEDVGRLPVTRDSELVGIVTRTDLIRTLYMKEPDDSEFAEEFTGR